MSRCLTRLACALAALTIVACGGGPPQASQESANGAAAGGTLQINGAGAPFPNPIYSKWFAEYNRQHPNVAINYQPIGSGGGVRQLTNRTVFFGASDMPMTDDQLKAAPGPVLHFPTVLGAVVTFLLWRISISARSRNGMMRPSRS